MSRILALTARFGAGPGGAAQAVERRAGFAGAAVFLHQVHARERHVELGVAGVLEQHEVALVLALRRSRAGPGTAPTPCSACTTKSPGLRSARSAAKVASVRFCDAGLRDQFGGLEQILGAEEGELRSRGNAVPRRTSPLTR